MTRYKEADVRFRHSEGINSHLSVFASAQRVRILAREDAAPVGEAVAVPVLREVPSEGGGGRRVGGALLLRVRVLQREGDDVAGVGELLLGAAAAAVSAV